MNRWLSDEQRKVIFDLQFTEAAVPRVHGNGFIQLDIGPGTRLHIWGHPDLPRQKQDTGIHDHVFDFVSTCVVGRVINAHYRVDYPLVYEANATHRIFVPMPREGEDTELVDSGTPVRASIQHLRMVNAGESYSWEQRAFHETFSDRPSATIMRKTNREKVSGRARVLVPLGAKPDNNFRRQDFPPAHIWAIIHEVLA